MKNEITTVDLSEFGYQEIEMAKDLLTAYLDNGVPEDFIDDEIKIMFNKNSGYVFFTNSEYQVAFSDNGKLYSFYNCSECGHEGSKEDGFELDEDNILCDECFKKQKGSV